MKISRILGKALVCLVALLVIDYLPVYAQKQKTKVTIIKESYDEHGNKTVQKITKEGEEADAIDLDNFDNDLNKSLQWQKLDLDSLGPFEQFFGNSFDFNSLFDSLNFGQFEWGDGDFPFLGKFDFNPEDDYRPKLGIKISEMESQSGVLVTHVLHDTPAARAGLREGDVILALDNKKVELPQDVVDYIQSLRPEDEVVIDVLRENEHVELTAVLTEYKAKQKMEIRKL